METVTNFIFLGSEITADGECSTSFVVQVSQPYMNTAKTIALITWTFVSTF